MSKFIKVHELMIGDHFNLWEESPIMEKRIRHEKIMTVTPVPDILEKYYTELSLNHLAARYKTTEVSRIMCDNGQGYFVLGSPDQICDMIDKAKGDE